MNHYGTVKITDNSIWISHIKGDDALVKHLNSMKEGEVIKLQISNFTGVWQKMNNGKDGRITHGIKPYDETTNENWKPLLAEHKGGMVNISLAA